MGVRSKPMLEGRMLTGPGKAGTARAEIVGAALAAAREADREAADSDRYTS